MIIKAMNQEEAIAISNWHYEGIYRFYDLTEDLEDYTEFINEETRINAYSVFHDNQLIGYFIY